MDILQMVNENRPVSRKQSDEAIDILEKMKIEGKERNLDDHVNRLEDMIDRIKCHRNRKFNPRPLHEIQKDIDKAQDLIVTYRMNRQYEIGAKWERYRDEYIKEYAESVKGKLYIPNFNQELSGKRASEGFQMSI